MSFSCGSVYNLDSNTNPMCNLISPEELERGCYTLVFLLHRQFHNMFITFLFKENVLHFNGPFALIFCLHIPFKGSGTIKSAREGTNLLHLCKSDRLLSSLARKHQGQPIQCITLNRNLTADLKIIYSLFMVWTVKRVHRGSILQMHVLHFSDVCCCIIYLCDMTWRDIYQLSDHLGSRLKAHIQHIGSQHITK